MTFAHLHLQDNIYSILALQQDNNEKVLLINIWPFFELKKNSCWCHVPIWVIGDMWQWSVDTTAEKSNVFRIRIKPNRRYNSEKSSLKKSTLHLDHMILSVIVFFVFPLLWLVICDNDQLARQLTEKWNDGRYIQFSKSTKIQL